VTPASPDASDALPGTPLPTLRAVQDRRSPGFRTGSSASSSKASALSLTEADKPRRGLACLAGEAAARTAAQRAVPGAVLDRPWPQPLSIESRREANA
jgi:hypothetical protein